MKRMGIRTKLFACFGLLMVAAAAGSVYSLATIRQFRTRLSGEIVASATRLDQARRITIALANMRTAQRGVSLFGLMKNLQNLEKAHAAFAASAAEMQQTTREMKATQLTDQELAAANAIEEDARKWLESFPPFVQLCASGHAEEASQNTLKTLSPIMDAIQKNATEFGRGNLERQRAAVDTVNGSIARNEALALILLLTVFLAGGAGFAVAARLVRSLRQIEASVAAGARQVADASDQVASSSHAMAQGSSEQAASLEETSSSTEEISSMARRNTENSQAGATIVAQSREKFDETNHALDQMVVAMAEIDGSSDKISKIIKVIDEIAFQTNILALNAAVEAARAGQAGLGFAVVADEVRNLAQRCAQAARDTTTLIEESITKSKGGKAKVDQVTEAIRAITAESSKVKTLVDEVYLGSTEQTKGIEQIGKAILQMEQVTQTTAASAEENAAAAQELRGQSEKLKEVVEQLSALVHGASE